MRYISILITIYGLILQLQATPVPEIQFLDVGVGDATMIRAENFLVIIDAGPLDNILTTFGDGLAPRVDLLVLTHAHDDHVSGARYLLERYAVEMVLLPNICGVDEVIARLYADGVAGKGSTTFRVISNRDRFVTTIPESSVKLSFFLPRYDPNGRVECINATSSSQVNDNSIVTEVLSPRLSMLLMGDTEEAGERALLRSGILKSAVTVQNGAALENNVTPQNSMTLENSYDVLKAGHHCSSTSTTAAFLDFVAPKVVVCSTGEENSYGHPSREVLRRIEEKGIEIRITYLDNEIIYLLE